MKKHLRLLALAALMVLPLAACDEGDDTAAPETVTGNISGTVTVDGVGQSGVTVTLSSGATQTTGATGTYTFSNVAAGAYTVTISGAPLADVTFPASVKSAVIATAGQTIAVNFDGARTKTSSILGSVTSTGGVAVNGVTVTATGPETKTATTANGQYSLTGMRAGTYTVTITTIPAGTTCTTTSASVVVAAGEAKVQNFTCSGGGTGGSGTITGVLFTDVNSNGVQDAGENTVALSGVWVYAEGPQVGQRDSVTTSDGRYTFSNKAAGTYTVNINPAATTFTNAGIASVAPSSRSITVPANGSGTANFGFLPTTQRVNVYAYLGRDANAATGYNTAIPTDVKPLRNVVIWLYADEASAIAGGTTGRIGVDTTDANGETQFSFLRTADTGPGGVGDQIVFAQYVSAPAPYVQNGEQRIEIRYDVQRQPSLAPDTFDLLNPTVNLKLDVFGTGTRTPLGGWTVSVFTDTTLAANASATTDASGKAVVPITVGSVQTNLPINYFMKVIAAQPAANGHAFTLSNAAEQATPVGSYLRYTMNGTVLVSDTTDLGDQIVKFSDTDVRVRVHHERDDSLNPKPWYSSGDDVDGAANIQVGLRYTNAAGTVVNLGPLVPSAFDGTATFPNVPTGRAPYIVWAKTTTANQFVLEEDTLFTVGQNGVGDLGGGTTQTFICPLGKALTDANCSTFAQKLQTGTINVTVRDSTALGTTNADSVKIRVRSDPRTIQPAERMVNGVLTVVPFDTLLTVGRGGVGGFVTLTGLRDGFYIVSVLHDSITTAGDTVWAFLGAANQSATVDVQSQLAGGDVDNVYFNAKRGDTQIQGVIVNDRDQDLNTIDPGEALSGVTVSLYRDNVGAITLDTLVKTVVTDANGGYSFTGLREGRYTVKVTQPSGAVVLRSFSGTTAIDTVTVTTSATAAATCQNANNLRRVGTNDPSCFGGVAGSLPSWSYTTSTAANVGPSSFTFLYSTGTVRGVVQTAAAAKVANMTMTLRLCATSAAPATPTAGACATYAGGFTPVNVTTDVNGNFLFGSLREGVYEVTPSPASAGYTSTTPATQLYTINAANDIETGNFQANP